MSEVPQPAASSRRKLWIVGGIIFAVLVFSYLSSRNAPRPVSEYRRDHPIEPASREQLKAFGESVENPVQKPQGMTEEQLRALLAAENAKGDQQGAQWQQQNTVEQQAAEERRRKAEAALAASNVVVSFRQHGQREADTMPGTALTPSAPLTTSGRIEGRSDEAKPEEKPKYPWNSATGKTHIVLEGTLLPCTLMNRLNGSFTGPVNCQVSMDILSHNHEHVLIPQGSVLVGDVSAVNDVNQERLMVTFHRIEMPDGYSWDLEKFPGLDQAGATALKDKTNRHLIPAFAAALAIGAIGGLAQVGSGYSGFGYSPGTAIRNGFSSEMSQESMQILQRYLTRLPTFVIREGQRVRVYVVKDMTLPEYNNHSVDEDL